MLTILSLALSIIFAVLSGIHFYWLTGGSWGIASSIPTKSVDAEMRKPPAIATLIVALGLAGLGIIYLTKSGALDIQLPTWLMLYGGWGIPSIFALRAVGDFNYLGLFKKIKGTLFAKADTQIFVPLCLGISIAGFLIQIFG